jgi:hypothetical protein
MLRSSRTGPTKIGSLTRASTIIVGALVALFGVIAGPLLGVFATSASAATASGYTAITPFRALGTPAAGAMVTAGTPVNVAIVGNTAAPTAVPAGATAVVLTLTASNPSAAGYLEVYPQGAPPASPTSNINFVAGQTIANLVTVPLSSAGGVTVLNFTGSTAVDVDVDGYYSAAGAGLYNPISPVRVSGANGTSVPSGTTATAFTVTGATDNVPAGATAVVVNLTASGGTAASYLSAYAAGVTPAPTGTSSLNFLAGQTAAARDIVNVGTGGQIDVFNLAGTVNVDVDVDGYYGATGATFTPLATPYRLTDTRAGTALNGTSIASGGTETFNMATAASGIPAASTGVAANFTVVPGVAPGYITVFPVGVATAPNASDVNWPANSAGTPVANFTQADTVTSGTTAGSTQVFNLASGSPVDVIIDAFGYFSGGTTASAANPVTDVVTNPTTPTTGAVLANGTQTEAINSTVYHLTAAPANVVANDNVLYTVAAGSATSCGTVTPTSGTTTAAGTVSTTYKAPAYSAGALGTCTVTATDSIYGETSVVTITQTAPANTIVVTGNANIAAAVTSTDTLTVTVNPGTPGEPVNSEAVTLTKSLTPAGVCGTITTPVTTPATGAATFTDTYTATAVAGICYIDVTDLSGANTEVPIDQTNPSLATASIAQTTTSPQTIPTTTGTVTDNVTVTNSGGPIVGDQVAFTLVGDCVGTSPSFTVTGAGGVASYAYGPAPATAGTCTITAQEADSAATTSLSIVQTAPVTTVAVTGGTSIGPGTTETITVTPTNPPTSDASSAVTFTVAGVGGFAGCGAAPATATASATTPYPATSPYTAGGTSGFCTITATEGGVSGSLTVDQT